MLDQLVVYRARQAVGREHAIERHAAPLGQHRQLILASIGVREAQGVQHGHRIRRRRHEPEAQQGEAHHDAPPSQAREEARGARRREDEQEHGGREQEPIEVHRVAPHRQAARQQHDEHDPHPPIPEPQAGEERCQHDPDQHARGRHQEGGPVEPPQLDRGHPHAQVAGEEGRQGRPVGRGGLRPRRPGEEEPPGAGERGREAEAEDRGHEAAPLALAHPNDALADQVDEEPAAQQEAVVPLGEQARREEQSRQPLDPGSVCTRPGDPAGHGEGGQCGEGDLEEERAAEGEREGAQDPESERQQRRASHPGWQLVVGLAAAEGASQQEHPQRAHGPEPALGAAHHELGGREHGADHGVDRRDEGRIALARQGHADRARHVPSCELLGHPSRRHREVHRLVPAHAALHRDPVRTEDPKDERQEGRDARAPRPAPRALPGARTKVRLRRLARAHAPRV